jgi:butyryl-CoA dehydrogenase
MADKAIDSLADSTSAEDQQFLAGKLQAAQYFIRWELPKVEHQANLLQGFDETCMSMQADWF